MVAHPDKVAALLEDDATAELFEDALPALDPGATNAPAPALVGSASARDPSEPSTAREPAPGLVLRDRYILEQRLAAGGTAIVYRARDLRREEVTPGGGLIAVKFLRPEKRGRPHAVESLQHEFQYAQTLSHPNIARVFDLDRDSGLWFLTLELLEGESLSEFLRKPDKSHAPRRALDILRDCGEALAFAHDRGVVHGDFKPGNVFITQAGQVRVLDFGAAAASWRSDGPRVAAATPPYASPQVLAGERPERRDDVFSFACVAYELLNGHHPFGRRSSLEARIVGAKLMRARSLSLRQWRALEAGLAWEREQRPATLRAMLAELGATDVASPSEIPEISVETRTGRRPTIAPVGPVLALAVLVVSALGLAYLRLGDRSKAIEPAVTVDTRAKAVPEPKSLLPEERIDSAPVAQPAVPAAMEESIREEAPVAAAPVSVTQPVASRGRDSEPPSQPAALITLDTSLLAVTEGAVAAVLRISRSQQLAGPVRVTWRTQAGSALPGEDYIPIASGTAEFADGQQTRALYIPLLDDRRAESDETFAVELFASEGDVQIFPTARAQVTIRDDD
jgi:serine/threonine protein kinase